MFEDVGEAASALSKQSGEGAGSGVRRPMSDWADPKLRLALIGCTQSFAMCSLAELQIRRL